MKSIVVYFSKSGNTKTIAEIIAKSLNTEALPLNIPEKRGKGTPEEQEKEKTLFETAIQKSQGIDLLIIGTPACAGKAPALVRQFADNAAPKAVGLFCTHISKLNTTISDLVEIFTVKQVNVADTLVISGCKSGLLLKEGTDISVYEKKVKDFVNQTTEAII